MYCSVEDIKNIIPQRELINLTNDEVMAETEINMDAIILATEHADNLIDCSLRAKYKLPLSFIPPVIKNLSADISAYRIYLRRPSDIPEHIVNNHKTSLSLLEKIQSGKMLLDMPSEHPDSNIQKPPSMFLVNKTEKDKIFNDGFLAKYRNTL